MLLETILTAGTYGLLDLLFGVFVAVVGTVVTWFGLSRLRLLSIASFPVALTVLLTAVGALWFNWDIVTYLTGRAGPDQRQALLAAHISVGFGLALVIGMTLTAFGMLVLAAVHTSPNDTDDEPVNGLVLVVGGVLAAVVLGVFGAWFAAAVTVVASLSLVRLAGRSAAASWMGVVAVACLGMGLGGIHNALDMSGGFRAVAMAPIDLKVDVMATHVAGLTGMWAAMAGLIAIVPAAVVLARDRLIIGVVGSALAIGAMSAATLLVEMSVTTPMIQMMSAFTPDGRLLAEIDERIVLPRVPDAAHPPLEGVWLRALPHGLFVNSGRYAGGMEIRDWTRDGSSVDDRYVDFGVIPELAQSLADERSEFERRDVPGLPVEVWADSQAPWSLLEPVVTTVSRVVDATVLVAVVVPDSRQGVLPLVTTTADPTESFSTSPSANAVLRPDPSTTLDELSQALLIDGVRISVPAETMPAIEPVGTEPE